MTLVLLFKAVIVAIVEGITEFLPISSTGHMIIIGNLIGFKEPFYPDAYTKMFEVVIQLGAILAVVVLYWGKIWDSFKSLYGTVTNRNAEDKSGLKLWTNIIVAFIPAAVIGLLLHSKIQKYLFNSVTVSMGFIFGGVLLILIENKYRRGYKTRTIDEVSIPQAFKIGCFQCLALWPGMSRSASTIMGAWIGGLSTTAAAEFSFFLAIPTMVAASGLELIKTDMALVTGPQVIALGVGFIVAFAVALFVIEKFIGFLQKKPMRVFAIYRIFMGIIFLLLAFTKVIAV